MNTGKSLLFSLLMVGFISTTTFASTTSPESSPISLTKQFGKLLKGFNMDYVESGQTVYVDFMINERSEIMVLSTSDQELDKHLKSKLNYKVIEAANLELFKRYTVPISFKK